MKLNWKKLRNNIPNKIQIGSRTVYELYWTQDFHFDNEDEKTYGITRYEPKQIVINSNQGDKETVLTMLHEFLHAYSYKYDINLTESQISAFEKGLPYLIDFILKLDGKR